MRKFRELENGTHNRDLPWRDARRLVMIVIAVLLAMGSVLVACSAPERQPPNAQAQQSGSVDWKAVEQAMGMAGSTQPGDVYKFSLPRSDLQVTVNGLQLKPALALGSWVAFKKMGNDSMVMGDLVLTEDEISPVMAKLQEGGIEQTALHNHVLHESPRVMYMHIGGRGDPVKLAQAIHNALALSKTPLTPPAGSGSQPQDTGIDTKQIDQIMGQSGKANGVVYQYTVPRAEQITDEQGGMVVPPSMGTATAINFQPTGGGKAAITGDFVLIASEVNLVIRALRDNGIEVTALHSHMLTESPRLFFMHFWANDDAQKLARGLRAALDKVNIQKNQTK